MSHNGDNYKLTYPCKEGNICHLTKLKPIPNWAN